MHKMRLLEYYRAADIVLDQFHEAVGSFGTVTVEAMACGRPVIMYFNPQVHEWCLEENPAHSVRTHHAGDLRAVSGACRERRATRGRRRPVTGVGRAVARLAAGRRATPGAVPRGL